MPEFRALLEGGGEMAERIRAHDWASSPLGPPRGWPQSLRTALSVCLNSAIPTAIYWGPELILFYNDAWSVIPGPRHPAVLGKPAREAWFDVWPVVGPQLDAVVLTGRGIMTIDQPFPSERDGRMIESWWDYGFTPIAREDGGVGGVLAEARETTDRVLAARQATLLSAINEAIRPLDTVHAIITTATGLLGTELAVGRVGYGEIDASFEYARIEHNWLRPGMPSLVGDLQLGGFGPDLHAAMVAGEIFRVDDALKDPRVAGTPFAGRYAAAGIRSGIVAPLIEQGRYSALIFAQDDRPRAWTVHHETLLARVATAIWQEVARVRAETALRASEERHRLIFEQAEDLIFTADLDQTITAANPASVAALGVPPEQIVGHSIGRFISAEDFARTSAMLRRKLERGGTTGYEVDVIGKGGLPQRWEVNSTLAINADGKAIGLHAIARDVTERRAFERRQQLLINELNHRVKNTLALVQGLAMQSFSGDRAPAEARAAFEARLATLAAAHDLLTRERWEGATLAGLIADATRPHADPAGRIVAEGPGITLNPKAAISLVLALHELATNAAKYGALAIAGGQVEIGWWIAGDRLALRWIERGGPPVSPPERRGFGLRMIERALANDLDGTVAIDFAPDGLVCTVEAPIPAATA